MTVWSIATACLAAISTYVGAYHVLFYMRRRTRENLAFAFLCFSIAWYDVFCVGLYSASSWYVGMVWQRWQYVALTAVAASMLWFSWEFTRQKKKWIDVAFLSYWAFQALFLIFDQRGWTWSSVPSIKEFTFLGIPVTYHEMHSGILTDVQSFMGFAASLTILQRIERYRRREDARRTAPVIVGLACFLIGVASDAFVSSGMYEFLYVMEYAFLALIVGMDYSLTSTFLESQHALQESEAKYRRLLGSLPDVIYTVDRQGTITSINQACATVFGYSREEMLGKPFHQFLHPDSLHQARRAFEEALKERRSFRRMQVLKAQRKDGTQVWISLNAATEVDPAGNFVQNQGVIRDITEIQAAGEALARLGAAVEAAEESIVITDRTGKILYVNPCFEKMTGYARDEILGKTPAILRSGRHGKDFYTGLWATISRGHTWRGHFTNRKKDGSLFEEEAVISPVRNAAGEIVNFVAVKRDVTQQLLLETQLRHSQTMEAIGRLARGVAHDFTNMLVVITNHAHFARKKASAAFPDIVENLDEITQAADRAARLTGELLAFSHQQSVTLRPIDMNRIVRSLEELVQRTLEKDIHLTLQADDTPLMIRGDASQLEQAIVHLVVNACDAMNDGGQLTLETSQLSISRPEAAQFRRHVHGTTDVSGDFAVLSISDTGCGMAPDVRAHVFEPFFTTKGKGKSTGLGLSTVHGIILQHDGFVAVNSYVDGGTTFSLFFPLLKPLPADDKTPAPAGAGRRVLLVEEDGWSRSTLVGILQSFNFVVIETERIEQAMDWIRHSGNKPDLIVTDICAASGSGRQLVDMARAILPRVPYVLTCGHPRLHLLEARRLRPEELFIPRPFVRSRVGQIVAAALEKSGPTATSTPPC